MGAPKYAITTEGGKILIGLRAIGEHYGIAASTLHQRVVGRKNRKGVFITGMSIQEAISTPIAAKKIAPRKTKQESEEARPVEKHEQARAECLGQHWRLALGLKSTLKNKE